MKKHRNFKDLLEINPDDFKPLYAQLSDALIHHIQSRDLKPGDSIPSEAELTRHYGISRMTVRLAMQRLATEGLIRKVQGKGTFVAAPKISAALRGARTLEESFADQGIILSNHLLQASIDFPNRLFLNEMQLPPGSRAFKIRRLKKWNETPVGIEIRNIPIDVAGRFSSEEIETMPTMELLNRHPDLQIHHVNYRIVSSVLMEREAEILQAPAGSAVLVQFMTHFNYEKRPVAAGRLTFLGERVEIILEFHSNGENVKTINFK